jgi:hypothetical protein
MSTKRLLVATIGCGFGCTDLLAEHDSTDVSGTYAGNATYTIAWANRSDRRARCRRLRSRR